MNGYLIRRHAWSTRCAQRGRHSPSSPRTRGRMHFRGSLLCLILFSICTFTSPQSLPRGEHLGQNAVQHSDTSVPDVAVRHLRGGSLETGLPLNGHALLPVGTDAAVPRLLKSNANSNSSPLLAGAGLGAGGTTPQSSPPPYGGSGSTSPPPAYGCASGSPLYGGLLPCAQEGGNQTNGGASNTTGGDGGSNTGGGSNASGTGSSILGNPSPPPSRLPSPLPSPVPTTGGGSGGGSGSGGGTSSSSSTLSTLCTRDRLTAPSSSSSCGDRKVAVLFTVGPAAAAAPGATLLLCAEPAAYSPEAGTLTTSFCWRSGDVPDTLLAADALTVTLPRLKRYGIQSMAAGGYALAVSGADTFGAIVHPTAAGGADAAFGPFAAGSASAAVGVPAGGAAALTLWFTPVATAGAAAKGAQAREPASRAVGFLTVELAGPPNPPQPATTCKCAVTAASPSGCPAGTAPLIATTDANATLFAIQCAPVPSYDKFSRKISFSTCWRYGCLPATFTRLPYRLLLGPLSAAALGSPPAGTYRLRGSAPVGVSITFQYTSAAAPMVWMLAPAVNSTTGGSAGVGGAGSAVTVPSGGLGEVRVLIQLPFDINVDDSAGSLELSLVQLAGDGAKGGSGSSGVTGGMVLETPDGSAATPPPMPAAATVANAILRVVSELWVPRWVGAGGGAAGLQAALADLEARVRAKVAAEGSGGGSSQAADSVNVTISLVGFRLVLPVEFRDFSAVPDCSQTSLESLRAGAATALSSAAAGGSGVTLLSVGCSYGAYAGTVARRRALLANTCTARMNVPVAVDTPPVDLDAFLPSATSSLSTTYGTSACSLDPESSAIQVISKLEISVSMPASKVTSSWGSGGEGATSAAASTAACTTGASALTSSLGLADGQARLVGCQLSAAAPDPEVPPSTPPPASGGSTSGGGVGIGLIAAAVAGGVVAVLVVAVAVVIVRKRRRQRRAQFVDMDSAEDGTLEELKSCRLTRSAVKAFHEDNSDDSGETTLTDARKSKKRVRRSGGGGVGSRHDTISALAQSSRSIPSSRTHATSSNFQGVSPRPSAYGSESIVTGAGGLESVFLSVVPPVTAMPLTPEISPAAARHMSSGGTGASGISHGGLMMGGGGGNIIVAGGSVTGSATAQEIQGSSFWPDSPVRHGAARSSASASAASRMARVSHPGCPLPTGDEDMDPVEISVYGEQSFPARCSRLVADARYSGEGGSGAGTGTELYDFFGFQDVADGAVRTASVMASLPVEAGPGLAARRSNDSGTAQPSCHRTNPRLRRSNGGTLPLDASSGLSEDDDDVDDEEEERQGGRGDPFARRTQSKPLLPTPPASPPLPMTMAAAAAAAPRSSLPAISPSNLHAMRAMQLRFALPGADTDEILPYGIEPIRTDSDGGASHHHQGAFSTFGERDLLRVQSRRPAFLDRTGGTLAAAVAATVALLPPGVDEYDINAAGSAAGRRRTYSRTAIPHVEPRRSGFIRRNTVMPQWGTGSPTGMPYIRDRNCPGSGSSLPGGGVVGGGWSLPASAANSPAIGQVNYSAWVGVLGGTGRRSSAGGGSPPTSTGNRSESSCGGSVAAAAAGGGGINSGSWGSSGNDRSAGRRLRAPPPMHLAAGPSGGFTADEAAAARSEKSTPAGATAAAATAAAAAAPPPGPDPELETERSGSGRTIRRPPRVHVSGGLDPNPDLPEADPGPAGRVGSEAAGERSRPETAASGSCQGRVSAPSSRPSTLSSTAPPTVAAAPRASDLHPPPQPHQTGLHPSPPPLPPLQEDTERTPRRLPPLPLVRPAQSDYGSTVHVTAAGSSSCHQASGGSGKPTRGVFVTIGDVVPPSPPSSPSPPVLPTTLTAFPDASPAYTPLSPPLPVASSPAAAPLTSPDGAGAGSRTYRSSEDSNQSSNGSHHPLEELNPAFGPSSNMRARQLYCRSSSTGSSNGSTGRSRSGLGGMGGLADREVEANAAGGTARLAMMRRLAVGPPRPAWGLVHAGAVPFKRSIAGLQYLQGIKDRPSSGVTGPAAPLPAADPGGGGGGGSGTSVPGGVNGPHSQHLPPGRLLHRNSTGSMRGGSFKSSDMSGGFIRLVGEV